MTEKVATTSASLLDDNITKLREVFPSFVHDGQIDFDALQAFLKKDGVLADGEKYGLSWAGKSNAFRAIRTTATGTLVPQPNESKNWDSTENLFIEGDNLEVLKLLQKHYREKIKMIYIDPPYNTGKDFVYKDNFTQGIADYYEQTGQTKGGIKMTTNTEKNGRYHSDWLTMMYPRLFLARNLLKDDGVIFVSIDDNEVANLRLIMDEIFGEENFVTVFIWNNEGNIDNQSKVKINHEYILCFAKNINYFEKPAVIDPNIEETSKLYNNQIENSITKNGPANPPSKILLPVGFPTVSQNIVIQAHNSKYPYLHDPIIARDFKLTKTAVVESGWSSKNLLELFINNGCQPIIDAEGKETWFAVTDTGAIYVYKKRADIQSHVLSVLRNFGTTKQNSGMLAEWGLDFTYPKPVFLIKYLVDMITGDNDIILDFFAGSATTAHAVMESNSRDTKNRKWICVQLPEVTDEDSEAHKAGYKTIAEISRERIRRAGEKIGKGDIGFKSYKLSQSNYRQWQNLTEQNDENDLKIQMELFLEKPLVDGYDEKSVVYEILTKEGFGLNAKIEQEKGDLKPWVVVDEGKKIVVTFANQVSHEQVEKLKLSPDDVFVCFDSALDDTGKVNIGRGVILKTI